MGAANGRGVLVNTGESYSQNAKRDKQEWQLMGSSLAERGQVVQKDQTEARREGIERIFPLLCSLLLSRVSHASALQPWQL